MSHQQQEEVIEAYQDMGYEFFYKEGTSIILCLYQYTLETRYFINAVKVDETGKATEYHE